MGTMKRFLILALFLFSISSVIAVQPQQSSNKIFVSPYYRASMSQNTNYSSVIIINPPDGISSVISAIISMDVYQTPSVTYTMSVNGILCATPSFSVSTTYSGSGQGRITFDCSNVIKKSGTYTTNLRVTQANTGASTMWLDLTYMNRPKSELQVFGTEYYTDQDVKVWLQLINPSGEYINNGVCYVDIYTPENAQYLEKAQMTAFNHDGIYYYDMPSPILEGVYPVIAECYYTAVENKTFMTSYELSRGILDGGTITDTTTINSVYLKLRENAPNPRKINVNISMTGASLSACANVNPTLLTGINVFLNAKFDSVVNDDITISIFNWTSNTWKVLPNKLLEGNVYSSVSNFITLNNITSSGLYTDVKGMKVRLEDTSFTDTADDKLEIDQFYIGCDELANPEWQDVKGSSELHITQKENILGGEYFVQTLCGVDGGIFSSSSGCAEFRNDANYWNYTWGYIYENITFLNNYQIEIHDTFIYETQLGQDCTGVIDIIKETNSTSESILNDSILSVGNKENCNIEIPVDFSNSTDREFHVVITQDNYMKWEVQKDKDFINYYKLVIEPFCQEVADASGSSYNIPIEVDGEQNISELYADRPIFLTCYRTIDDLYWFDYYYNVSKSITTTGLYESYLLEARYYYPEIRTTSQVIQSVSKNIVDSLFNVQTLCGDTQDSDCAIAHIPDGYFSSQEGYIIENLSITNTFNTQLVGEYVYTTSSDVDCTAVLEVILYHGNGSTEDITNDINYGLGESKNCIMNIPISFDDDEDDSNILIYMENYIHWNMFQMEDKINSVRNNTEDFCNQLATDNAFTYTFPITSSIDNITNNDLRFCYRAMDDLYWLDFYDAEHEVETGNHTLSVPMGTIEGTYAEFLYFYPIIMQDYEIIKQYQRNANQILTLNMVSDIVNNTHLRVWNWTNRTLTQNISINTTQIANEVWSSTNKTLTYYPPQEDMTNYTQVANYVWSYTGNVTSNILNQIGTTIWEWVTRYTHGEIV